MSDKSKELQEALLRYTTDTLAIIHIVRTFSKNFPEWLLQRELELDRIKSIRDRADKLDLSFSHVNESQQKFKAFLEYMKCKVSAMERQRDELEGELADVLKDTLLGLQKLCSFLEATEKLAATSLHVFWENPVIRLPKGIGLDDVQVVIFVAKHFCSLVLDFKSDAERFFAPKLQNIEVLIFQLEKYMKTTKYICDRFEKSSFSDFFLESIGETEVDLKEDYSEHDVRRMLDHIEQLAEIRLDPNFRIAFLFKQEVGEGFISEFDQRKPQMLQCLKKLEEAAVQLDRMNKGARISTVAGSSVGATGGVLSIIGLALMPVTMGVSLGLTVAGLGMGATSALNSAITTFTEIGVNKDQKEKASVDLQSFMENVEKIQDCLDRAKSQSESYLTVSQKEVAVGISRALLSVGSFVKGIDSLIDAASAINMLKSEKAVSGVGEVLAQEGKALRNVPRIASDLPDIGQAAAKSSVAMTKTARVGFITLNALFVGFDVFLICKDSINLAKGSETKTSKFIRARAALCSSVVDSWQEMRDSLDAGLPTSEKKEAILETPFYPESDAEEQEEMKGERPAEEEPAEEEPAQEEPREEGLAEEGPAGEQEAEEEEAEEEHE